MSANFVPVIGGHRAGPRGALTAGHHLVVLRGRQVAKRLDAVFAFIGGDDGIAAQAYEMLEAAFERGGPAGDLAPGQEEEFLRRLLATRLGPGDHPAMAVAILIRREVIVACRNGARVYWCRSSNISDALGDAEIDESAAGETRVARLAVAPRDSILLVGPEVAEHVAPEELEQAATGDSPAKQVASWLVALAVLRSSSPSSALVVQFFSSKTLVAQPGPPITPAASAEPVARPAFTRPPPSRPERPAASTSTPPATTRTPPPARRPLPPISSMPMKRPSSTPEKPPEAEPPPSERPAAPPPRRPAPPTVRIPTPPPPRPTPAPHEDKVETPAAEAQAPSIPLSTPPPPVQPTPSPPPVSVQSVSPAEAAPPPISAPAVAQPTLPAESVPESTVAPTPVPPPREAPPAPAASAFAETVRMAPTPAPEPPAPAVPARTPAPPPEPAVAPAPRAPTPAPTPVPAQSAAAASTSRPSPVFMSAPFWRFASVMVGVGASAAVLFLAVVLLGPLIQHNLPSISAAHTSKRQAAPTAVPATAPVVAPAAVPTSAPTVAPTRAPVPTAVISTAPRTTSVPAQTSEHSWTFPPLKTSGGQPELALFNPNASTVNARVRIIRAGHVDTRRVRISAGGIVRIPLTAAEVRPGGGPTDTLTVRTTAAIVPMRVVVGQSSGTTG